MTIRDIDDVMDEYRRKRDMERQQFLQKCKSKITDAELIYNMCIKHIADRFNISSDYRIPDAVFHVLEYYVEEVDEPLNEWLNKNDAPMIRKAEEMPILFHEFKYLNDNEQIMKMANEIYGLDLKYDYEYGYTDYVYSFSFDFNSFTPLDLDEIIQLKHDIRVLQKYDVDTSELEAKLDSFGLPKEIMEKL